jgi:hypothetical protein
VFIDIILYLYKYKNIKIFAYIKMENTNNEIVSLVIVGDLIKVTYDNNVTEELTKSHEFYVNMRTEWLVSQPPFISDSHKDVMNNIILACIHKNARSIAELNTFFSQGNEEKVKAFFTYMRKRDLTEEKKKWKIV